MLDSILSIIRGPADTGAAGEVTSATVWKSLRDIAIAAAAVGAIHAIDSFAGLGLSDWWYVPLMGVLTFARRWLTNYAPEAT